MNLFQLERDLEDGDKNIQRKLNHHAHIDTELSRPRPALESGTPSSVTRVLLPEPLAPALVSTLHLLTLILEKTIKMYQIRIFRNVHFKTNLGKI